MFQLNYANPKTSMGDFGNKIMFDPYNEMHSLEFCPMTEYFFIFAKYI